MEQTPTTPEQEYSVEFDDMQKSGLEYPFALLGPKVRDEVKGVTSIPFLAFFYEESDAIRVAKLLNSEVALRSRNSELEEALRPLLKKCKELLAFMDNTDGNIKLGVLSQIYLEQDIQKLEALLTPKP